MYVMRTIEIDDPGHLPFCVSRGFTRLRCANTAEQIEVLLRSDNLGDPRNIVLDDSLDFPTDSLKSLPNYFFNLFVLTNKFIQEK